MELLQHWKLRVFSLTFLSSSNQNPSPSPPLSFYYCPRMNATMLQLSLCAHLIVRAKFSLFKFTEICRVTPPEDLPSRILSCWGTNLLVLKPMFLNFQEQKRIVALNIDCQFVACVSYYTQTAWDSKHKLGSTINILEKRQYAFEMLYIFIPEGRGREKHSNETFLSQGLGGNVTNFARSFSGARVWRARFSSSHTCARTNTKNKKEKQFHHNFFSSGLVSGFLFFFSFIFFFFSYETH